MCVVVGGRRRELQRTLHGQLSDASIVTQQMTVVEIINADLRCLSNSGCRVGLCVFVNGVCAGDQCTCETTRAVSAARGLCNIDGKCRTAAPHTHNQGLITNMSNQVCPAWSVT